MSSLILYTKPDCCLCDDAAAALQRVRARVPFDLDVVDVSRDPELLAQYGERLPVVVVDGSPVFEYEVDERVLEDRLVAAGAAS